MRNLWLVAALFLALSFAGCARQKDGQYEDPAGMASWTSTNLAGDHTLIVTPSTGLNGKISSVNPNLRFVVITFPVGQMATVSQRLHVYRQGLKVGELTVTGPQRNDSIVADISIGETEKGDEVRDK